MFSLHAAWPCKPCVALADFFHVRSSWKQAIVGRSAQEGCPSAQKHAGYIAKTAVSPFQSRVGCMTVELHISPSWVMNYQKMQVQENRNSSPMCRLGSNFFFAATCWNQHKLHVAKSFQKFGQVLLQAKSHGSKRCSMQLLLHLFGPIHKRKDQCIKLSDYLLHQTRKDFGRSTMWCYLFEPNGWLAYPLLLLQNVFLMVAAIFNDACNCACLTKLPATCSKCACYAMLAFVGIALVAFPRASHYQARCSVTKDWGAMFKGALHVSL